MHSGHQNRLSPSDYHHIACRCDAPCGVGDREIRPRGLCQHRTIGSRTIVGMGVQLDLKLLEYLKDVA